MLVFENFILVLEYNSIAVFKFTETDGKYSITEIVPINQDTILQTVEELYICDFTIASLGLH